MTRIALRLGRHRLPVETRTLTVTTVAAVLIAATGLTGLCLGASWTHPADAVAALFGHGDSVVVIRDWRLPRVSAAIVFGAALGAAGAIFQNLTRNPLGSPDVIGLDAGAYTGTLLVLTLGGGTAASLATSSVAGGLIVATLIYLLALRNGGTGLRLIVIGIAVNAMVTAVNSWIVLRADMDVAIAAVGWSAGSLNGVDWDEVALPLAVIIALMATLTARSAAIHQAALGDAVAVTTGVNLNRLRLTMVAIGVGLTATVTAVAGPIAFIALAAPQIGRRLAKAPGIPLLPAALCGAVLLQIADLLAQLLLAPESLPVGVITTAIGGGYLIWLLTTEVKRA